MKINLALAELPEFTADPGFNPDIHGGAIQMLDDLDYLEKAFQEARFGQAATLAVQRHRDPDRVRQDARAGGRRT